MIPISGEISPNPILRAACAVLNVRFATLLQSLLDERDRTRSELYAFVFMHGCQMDQTAMYRYFNANPRSTRLPTGAIGQQFLKLFSVFLDLSLQEQAALELIWQIQRSQRRKNSSNRLILSEQARSQAVACPD